MKVRLFLGVIALSCFTTAVPAATHDSAWEQVDAAVQGGLPKTAIERLDPIIKRALAEKAYPEATKAIARKIALEGAIQGDKPAVRIRRLQAEMVQAPAPMHPMMEAILAHWYWQYFQQNRWRFMRRTATAEAPSDDIETWDLRRILGEIDRHFTAALANEAELKRTAVGDYQDLLEKGTAPDDYRPTLFDFLAYEALAFYQTGEQGVTVSEDEFEIAADGPIFADVDTFMQWQPVTTDLASPKLKAVHLFQALLRFHESDRDRSAFYDADLSRLQFGRNSAHADQDEHYKAALQRLIKETAEHEISARATAVLGRVLVNAGESLKAHDLARAAVRQFPDTIGAAECFNLIQDIEAPSVMLHTEAVWNAPWPDIDVTYRNVPKLFFRAVRVDFQIYARDARWSFGTATREQVAGFLAQPPALTWEAALPATSDYKEHTTLLKSPPSLKPGFYLIAASPERTFHPDGSAVASTLVWVSDLALVMRREAAGRVSGGFVLKANSGEPVARAAVRLYEQDREGWLRPKSETLTDENGRFELDLENGRGLIVAEAGGNTISTLNEFYSSDDDLPERSGEQTVFFTDRAIYRPGQTIHYKGIAIRYNQERAVYAVRRNAPITVIFSDPNGREIARATHRTNDYGSFSGDFTAPASRLTGTMTLRVDEGVGATNVQVEEYKRPKFETVVNAPANAPKLGANVEVRVSAKAYTGAPIDGAKVSWRVERTIELPYWCWWFRPPSSKAIAHGTAVTDAQGDLVVSFVAEPDRAVPEKNEPVFVFTLSADVTDTTGETRSATRTVRVGYSALQATVSAERWQTPNEPVRITVATASLNGDPQSTAGTLTVSALRQPDVVQRERLEPRRFGYTRSTTEPSIDAANPDSWERGATVMTQPFQTDAKGQQVLPVSLPAGIYRAEISGRDRFGHAFTARQTIQVLDPTATHFAIRIANRVVAPKWTIEPGHTFTAVWATGYPTGRAYVELEAGGKLLKSYWTAADRTQERIELPVTEKMRGGVSVRITYVRENRAYVTQQVIEVPWSNKQLTVKWDHFRSKLTPGQRETWTAVIRGGGGTRAAAEMVATMYDASLDQYARLSWPDAFDVLRNERSRVGIEFENRGRAFQIAEWPRPKHRPAIWTYRSFPSSIIDEFDGEVVTLNAFSVRAAPEQGYMAATTLAGSRTSVQLADVGGDRALQFKSGAVVRPEPSATVLGPASSPARADIPNLETVTARRNLNETAFFFPHLLSGKDGEVKLEFTLPEALTTWRFLGFAHDAQLRAGFLEDTAVASKDLMVQPNPPRFLREGDVVEFTVKVTNTSDAPQSGTVRLTFANAETEKPVDAALGNRVPDQTFDVPARQSRSFSWRIAVPDGAGVLTYKAVAATAKFSDGEEGYLPVLSRRALVTESLPLPIRGNTTKAFEFKKLLESGKSDTLRQESLTVQMTSQPAWYAVMALPYLMEYPYECSEQVFNRYYANTLARHVANSDPKIRRVFDLWKNTPALESPLAKNQELKSVLLEETPWVREAQDETAARHNVGVLFDANRLDEEANRTLQTLADRQLSDGLWSWFPGGRPSEYISLYIMTGFGRLRHLGVDLNVEPALKSVAALDGWMAERYRQIQKSEKPTEYVPGYTEALYLYGRSFFLGERPIAAENKTAFEFFLGQARKFWVKVGCRQCQAQLALALQRNGDAPTAQAIARSLKERSVSDEELGMFWRDTETSWWWYDAPIETQAMMIEVFDEVAHDTKAVEDCRVWLLKQKQTQDWRTTKATADAVYGLLLHGSNLLGSDALVRVSLGGTEIKPQKVETGTGFYEQKFVHDEIKPTMGHVTVTKTDEGVSWGSVHWQYLEDMAKVTPHEGTPLKLRKTLWVKQTTSKGQILKPVTGPVAVGDELVVRIELRTDRDMEFVHLKDQRGSGTEPVTVLSRYKYQDGLAYYESTRDTATHFFIDYLPKGTYVFEYSTRVQLKGQYQTGIAEIQCMYAPEFNSHSESIPIEVK